MVNIGIAPLDWLDIWPEVIKLFSCSTELSVKFQMLIKTIMLKNKDISCFQTLTVDVVFIMLINVKNANNCWHFNIYEQDKFRAQLS